MNRKIFTQSQIKSLLIMMSLTAFSLFGIVQSHGQNTAPVTLTLDNASWIPEDGNFAEVNVSVNVEANNSHIDFLLSGVTDWKGECMNYGDQSDSDKDLKFAPVAEQINAKVRWTEQGSSLFSDWNGQKIRASWNGTKPAKFKVKVKCYDYGAFGNLTAQLYNVTQASTIPIPLDANQNRIADAWENQKGVYTSDTQAANEWAVSDDEKGPGKNTNPGDGLSAFEEYRGFRTYGVYIRGNLNAKEIFVYSACTDIGYGYAGFLPSPFRVCAIAEYEMGSGEDDRRIDHKGEDVPGGSSTKQKALKVNKDETTVQVEGAGMTLGVTEGRGPPHAVGDITIYYGAIYRRVRQATRPSGGPGWLGFSPSADDLRKVRSKVLGHEIGHGINLHHHDIFTDDQQNPDPNYRCIMENGFTIKVSGNTKTVVVATVYRSFHIPDYKVR